MRHLYQTKKTSPMGRGQEHFMGIEKLPLGKVAMHHQG